MLQYITYYCRCFGLSCNIHLFFRLPLLPNGEINSRYMPTLGNGHISVTVYNEALHLNGLYNGAGGKDEAAMWHHFLNFPQIATSKAF